MRGVVVAQVNEYRGWPTPQGLRDARARLLPQLEGGPIGYSIASDAIRRIGQTGSPSELALLLRSLRTPLVDLRNEYRRSNADRQDVAIDYSGDTALAYCAAYLNPYIDLARWCIVRSLDPHSIGSTLRVGIIGLGVVGSTLDYGFTRLGHDVYKHDIKLGTNIHDVLAAELVFVCV